jgi:signal transduction histidine kinase
MNYFKIFLGFFSIGLNFMNILPICLRQGSPESQNFLSLSLSLSLSHIYIIPIYIYWNGLQIAIQEIEEWLVVNRMSTNLVVASSTSLHVLAGLLYMLKS